MTHSLELFYVADHNSTVAVNPLTSGGPLAPLSEISIEIYTDSHRIIKLNDDANFVSGWFSD